MEPEIARRCSHCGASVRGSAFFCPQCGTPAKAEEARAVSSDSKDVEKPHRRTTDGGSNTSIAPPASSSSATEFASGVAPSTEVVAPSERHAKRHRSRSSAREAVGEKLAPRMEKLRQASNVMLDEATYDPSLRFVLVAVAIFVLTLLLFLLHGLIG